MHLHLLLNKPNIKQMNNTSITIYYFFKSWGLTLAKAFDASKKHYKPEYIVTHNLKLLVNKKNAHVCTVIRFITTLIVSTEQIRKNF